MRKLRKKRLSTEDKVVNAVATIVCAIVLFVTLYPFYQCVIYSFNDGQDAMSKGLYFFPRVFTLANYKAVFMDDALILSFFVTVLRTVLGTVTGLFFTAMVAYGLSKEKLMFRKFYSLLALVTLYFSGGLIPGYLLLKDLHLLNNFLVYIIPGMFGYFNALLFMAFFRELPPALEESAKIDGAGYFYIFVRIVLPLSKPVLATVALFIAVGHWNDWFASAYYMNNMKLWTMPTILMRVLSSAEGLSKVNQMQTSMSGMSMEAIQGAKSITLESIKYATMVVTVVPIAVIYPFLQKYFVKGMLMGAVKA